MKETQRSGAGLPNRRVGPDDHAAWAESVATAIERGQETRGAPTEPLRFSVSVRSVVWLLYQHRVRSDQVGT